MEEKVKGLIAVAFVHFDKWKEYGEIDVPLPDVVADTYNNDLRLKSFVDALTGGIFEIIDGALEITIKLD